MAQLYCVNCRQIVYTSSKNSCSYSEKIRISQDHFPDLSEAVHL